MRRALFVLMCALVVAGGALAEDWRWEGTAAPGRYGDFPRSGRFAASNSFPVDTQIEVENIETGRKTTVFVISGLDEKGLLLLLSSDAAREIGVADDGTTEVRARRTRRVSQPPLLRHPEAALSPDPDRNPLAALMSREEEAAWDEAMPDTEAPDSAVAVDEMPRIPVPEGFELDPEPELQLEELPETEPPELVEEPVEPADEPPAIEVRPPVAVPEPAPVPKEPIAPEVSVRERLTEELELTEPDRPEVELPDAPPEVATRRPLVEVPVGDPEAELPDAPPEVATRRPLVEVPVGDPEAELPDAPPEVATRRPLPETPDDEVIVDPEELAPELEEYAPEVAERPSVVAEPDPAEDVAVSGYLEPGRFYVQLGAFRSREGASTLLAGVDRRYPSTVVRTRLNGEPLYRVYLGPLGEDEAGAALYTVRRRGYRDAFITQP